MKFLKFFFFLFLFSNFGFTQSEIPKNLIKYNVKPVINESIEEGFYVVSLKSLDKDPFSDNVKIVKRLENDFAVIHLKKSQKNSPPQIDYYLPDNTWKFSPKLDARKTNKNESVTLSISTSDAENFITDIIGRKVVYEKIYQRGDLIYLNTNRNQIENISKSSYCFFIDELPGVNTEANVSGMDLSTNQINIIHQKFPEYLGSSIKISIKEELFDLNDLDIKNRYFLNGTESENKSLHSTLMATLIAGGGNNSQASLGILPTTTISSSDFITLLPDNPNVYQNDKLFIQNHSYGTSQLENYYGAQAVAYDESTLNNPYLIHVFSSGNKGNLAIENGNFANISGYSNFTGNFKMAKNVLVVGGVKQDLKVATLSSKGPTNDGRLKPDLVAYGPEGTSDAAATVSGVTGILQEAFLNTHGEIPRSEIVKSVLIAGADDIEEVGPDFESGFGNVNAYKSLRLLLNNQYTSDDINSLESKNYPISIPSNSKKLRIALNWNDKAANAGDEEILINDLDIIIKKNGRVWKPWVLSTYPLTDSLAKPAIRGVDNKNTVELITIDNPESGDYEIEISAHELDGTQSFSFAYYIEKSDEFIWNYPVEGDKMNSEISQYLRWENTFDLNSGTLEFKINEGPWQVIAGSVDLLQKYYKWEPSNLNGIAQFRMSVGTNYFITEPFVISTPPRSRLEYLCDSELVVSWDPIDYASSYLIKNLGAMYMEEITSTSENFIILQRNQLESDYLSITPIFNEKLGVQGQTFNFNLQGVNCYFQTFYAYLNEEEMVETTLTLSTLKNISEIIITKTFDGQETVLTTVNSPTQLVVDFKDATSSAGEFEYGAIIVLEDGTVIETNKVTINVPAQNDLFIFPNPTSLEYGIGILTKGNGIDFQLIDLTGRVVLNSYIERREEFIDLPVLSNGLYIARILKNGKVLNAKKLIIYN
ncbi:S8 family peptidase [Aegicerativicinus sediminis]|uniref:S8 family peptidase n=1 Tax=Aegicerativicinus sediminis TaxID=2893202 RepID=UPI001E33C2EF|nr:S8 family peptidase [Aegicerativicinus sediminis]